METNNYQKEYQKAKKKVEEIKAFYSHALVFVLIMIFLVFINLKYSPNHLWFLYTFFGWGLGLAFHAYSTFYKSNLFGKNWEEKKIKELIDKEKKNTKKWE